MKEQNSNNIIKFQKQIHFNVGIVICFIILIYIIFHIFTYLTKDNISIYEVTQGSIATDYDYTALAIRNETVVYSDRDGYPYYYKSNNSTVGSKSIVYAIDDTGDIVNALNSNTTDTTDLSNSDLSEMENSISTFMNGYSDTDFQKIYAFKTDLTDSLTELYNTQAIDKASSDIAAAQAADTYHPYTAQEPGLLEYYTDGLEGLTVDSYSSENFDTSSITKTSLKTSEKITAGSPVYKLITSDHWNLVIQIDDELAEKLANTSALEIKFDEDNAKTWTTCSIEEKAGNKYLVLGLDDSVDRYAEYRYINIQLLIEDKTGLKIPNTAITQKKFFTIPKSYFYEGNDSDDKGVIIKGNENAGLVTPTIYYETDDYYYVDNEYLHTNDVLIKSDSKETYTVGSETATLDGVYNVNKGYAVFKIIAKIYENNDYSIVESGTDYGISLYDRIALQGDKVQENDIIN
ncbi:MAG: hypothetical protein II169_02150 [Lachnospiraceae bacterium]|nr:hypothetical protein [Lachnospiraceae bacterium]